MSVSALFSVAQGVYSGIIVWVMVVCQVVWIGATTIALLVHLRELLETLVSRPPLVVGPKEPERSQQEYA